jgi:hypothetical protein
MPGARGWELVYPNSRRWYLTWVDDYDNAAWSRSGMPLVCACLGGMQAQGGSWARAYRLHIVGGTLRTLAQGQQ